jgi:hypothetical protein
MNPLHLFAVGTVGALAPEIVRLYTIRNEPDKFKWSFFYLIVSALFAALGGFLAWILQATTYWSALYIGAATPVMINTITKKGIDATAPELRSAVKPQHTNLNSFINGL